MPEPTICSAKGCRNPATVALRWNNPKIHEPDRRKTWLACAGAPGVADRLPGRARLHARRGRGCDRKRDATRRGQSCLLSRCRRLRRSAPALLAADCAHGAGGLEERSSSMPWPGRLVHMARRQRSAISSSSAPPRSARAQVGLLAGEQAVADLAVGGQPDPVAVAAERPRHRGDDADRRRAAVDEEQLGGRAARARRDAAVSTNCRLQRREDLVGRRPSRSRLQPCWASSGICSMKRSS